VHLRSARLSRARWCRRSTCARARVSVARPPFARGLRPKAPAPKGTCAQRHLRPKAPAPKGTVQGPAGAAERGDGRARAAAAGGAGAAPRRPPPRRSRPSAWSLYPTQRGPRRACRARARPASAWKATARSTQHAAQRHVPAAQRHVSAAQRHVSVLQRVVRAHQSRHASMKVLSTTARPRPVNEYLRRPRAPPASAARNPAASSAAGSVRR